MISKKKILEYKDYIVQELLKTPKQKIQLTADWVSQFPNEAGVYLLWERKELIYVGESGSIKGRMSNLRNTVNHQVRRNIARKLFVEVEGYIAGSSKKKHPEHIELMLNDFLEGKVQVSYLIVPFGRKEVEEAICELVKPCYNNRERRKK